MRKLIVWLLGIGLVLFTVVVVLALVRAPFDPARMIKNRLFPKPLVYEAQMQLAMAKEMPEGEVEQWLQGENEFLDSEDFLAPLVQELGLVSGWQLAGEKEAVAKLRGLCEFRKGELPSTVVLAVRDNTTEGAGRIADAVGRSYLGKRVPAPPPGK